MTAKNDWAALLTQMSDERVEEILRDYLWLHATTNTSLNRIEQLMGEAERRGRPELIERARQAAGAPTR